MLRRARIIVYQQLTGLANGSETQQLDPPR